MLWAYNWQTKSEMESLPRMPLSVPFLAAHIRRGDKKTEVSYVPISLYAKAIKKFGGNMLDVYVATDDYRVIRDLRKELGSSRNIYSFAKDQSFYGYDQSLFNDATKDARRAQTLEFFRELELLFSAKVFFGSPTSNVLNLVRYMKANNGVVDVTEPDPRLGL